MIHFYWGVKILHGHWMVTCHTWSASDHAGTATTPAKTIWHSVRPRTLVQNQQTREVISAQKTSHKHNNKNMSPTVTRTWHVSRYWWSYVPCVYSHARWELPLATRILVAVFVWHLSSADELPCVLTLQKQLRLFCFSASSSSLYHKIKTTEG